MNLLHILTTSPHYFFRKRAGATNENLNFDLRVSFTRVWMDNKLDEEQCDKCKIGE